MALPDKNQIFDKDRPVTPLSHLIQDHAEGPAWSKVEHFQEYARLADHAGEDHAKYLMDIGYSIHYHVWDEAAMLELVTYLTEKYPLSLKNFEPNGIEVIIILKKEITSGIRSMFRRLSSLLRARNLVLPVKV